MRITIGNTTLTNGLLLAPMAGVTDSSFRLLCRSLGAEYCVSEMVSAKALCYEQRARRKVAEPSPTAQLARITKEEMPMAVQMFGSEPGFMAEAAKMLEEGSYRGCLSEVPPSAIDINMGCPMRKITGNHEGSALMKDPPLAASIVSAVVKAVHIPVTVKIRAGWDADTVNAPEFAKRLEDAGASMICVHARTREQLYTPGIDLSVIERTKQALCIPVVGNGDITSAEDALAMMQKTGCDGVMIGRGAMGNPWIFREITAKIRGEEWIAPDFAEKMQTACDHLHAMILQKGPRVGLAEGKKHMAWYISGVNGAAAARGNMMRAESEEDILRILHDLAQKQQDIL